MAELTRQLSGESSAARSALAVALVLQADDAAAGGSAPPPGLHVVLLDDMDAATAQAAPGTFSTTVADGPAAEEPSPQLQPADGAGFEFVLGRGEQVMAAAAAAAAAGTPGHALQYLDVALRCGGQEYKGLPVTTLATESAWAAAALRRGGEEVWATGLDLDVAACWADPSSPGVSGVMRW